MKQIEHVFSRDDKVCHDGKVGVVTKVSSQAVHVKYEDGYYQKFHFSPTHHMQSPISLLKHLKY